MVDQWVEIIKIVLAFGVGSFIGEERERNRKSIGVRTISLICVASAFIIIISQRLNPLETHRTIQGIITGVGFLGAGSIISSKGTVRGLTTAALTWAMAIIGIGIGLGEYVITISTTLIIWIILIIGKGTKKFK